jgi:hypothetical protein
LDGFPHGLLYSKYLQVGRSCHIFVQFKDKKIRKIMLDCVIHPGLTGMDALAFVDMVEADQIDLLLSPTSILIMLEFAMVPAEDNFQREVFHDPRNQGHLLLATLGLHQGQQHLHRPDAVH